LDNAVNLVNKRCAGKSNSMMKKIDTTIASVEKKEDENRKNLLMSYYFFNCYPLDTVTLENIIETCHTKFQKDLDNKNNNLARANGSQHIANIISSTNNPCAFGAMLKIYCPSRGGDVFDRVVDNLVRAGTGSSTNNREKLEYLLSNLVPIAYEEIKDGDRKELVNLGAEEKDGNYLPIYQGKDFNFVWLPSNHQSLVKILALIGKDRVRMIEEYHHYKNRVTGHRYRTSNVPNRHDYSNIKPYPGHVNNFVRY
jgi:hypothetical protein